MMRLKNQRGVALLLSLAILAVLAVLATTFTRLMIVEHHASANYVASSRARALASTGVEYALGKLRHLARNVHHSSFEEQWMYKMRFYDSLGSFYETSGAGLPIDHAIYPPSAKDTTTWPFGKGAQIYGGISWYKGNSGIKAGADPIVLTYPLVERVDELYNKSHEDNRTGRPVSGWIGSHLASSSHIGPRKRYVAGTHEDWGDTFALKVLDSASQINVNMQDGTPSGKVFPSPSLKSFLNDLGEEVDNFFKKRFTGTGAEKSWNKYELGQFGYHYIGFYTYSSGKKSKLGDWLISERNKQPGDVFQSKEAILTLFNDLYPSSTKYSIGGVSLPGSQVALEEYNKLKDFITLYGWRDRTVIEPGTLMTAEQWEVKDKAWKWRGARSPINMNTVSNPVLTAWLRGISYSKWTSGTYSGVTKFRSKFTPGRLRKLAYLFRQVTYRDPILAWRGLHALLQKLPGKSGGIKNAPAFQSELTSMGFDKWDRDAFLAMADPNATLNKFNPDNVIYRNVDKYDLTDWTTEMCFNSMGYYEITSLGTLTENGGQVRAQKKIRAVYQVFDNVVRSSQRDFELTRELTGIDPKSGKSTRLWDEAYWGVISYPEYRNKFRDYKETPLLTSEAPETYGFVAAYDGMLSFNALTRQKSYDGDFLAGFNYPLGKHPSLSTKSAVDGFKPKTSSSNARVDLTKYARSVSGKARLKMTTSSNDTKLSGSGSLTRFNGGSDAFPMGVYMDSLRKRYLAYDAKTAISKGTIGSVEFWVKPRFAKSVGKETWWYWSDSTTPTAQYIWCYRDGTNIVVDWSIGNSDGGKLLKYDASFWKDATWHHIHIDWGDTGRIFIDGDEADQGGNKGDGKKGHPEARHMDFGGWPPKTQEKMDTWTLAPDSYKSQISWVEKHIPKKAGKYKESGTEDVAVGYFKSGTYANATIDNLVFTTWRIFKEDTVTFAKEKIPVRYFPVEYRGYSRMYYQDITSSFAAFKRDIQLGTMAATIHDTTETIVRLYIQVGADKPEGAVAGGDGFPLKDLLSKTTTSKGGRLPWLGTAHEKLLWAAEFMTEFKSGTLVGTQETAFLHDFHMTYLLPSPQQMERREIDF